MSFFKKNPYSLLCKQNILQHARVIFFPQKNLYTGKILSDCISLQTKYFRLVCTCNLLNKKKVCKVHKAIIDICPPFRPILSAIGTPSYKIAKFLVPKLSSVTSNEFTVKDSFAFAEEIVHQDSKL